MKRLIKLFFIFLKIGAFTFGGGYAMIPLIEEEIVNKNKWVSEEEFLDIMAVAQSIPGAIAVNFATYIGYKVSGFWGAFMACLGAVLPSFLIILIIAKLLQSTAKKEHIEKIFNGIRPAVVSLILVAVVKLRKGISKNAFSYLIIIFTVVSVSLFNINPIFIIIMSGTLGYFFYKGVIQ